MFHEKVALHWMRILDFVPSIPSILDDQTMGMTMNSCVMQDQGAGSSTDIQQHRIDSISAAYTPPSTQSQVSLIEFSSGYDI